jgi:translation initiation factor IF-2
MKARLISQRRLKVNQLRKQKEANIARILAEEDAVLHGSKNDDNDDDIIINKNIKDKIERVRVVLKADSQGTLNALMKIIANIQSLCNNEVDIEIVSSGVGSVGVSDIELLTADSMSLESGDTTHGIVLAFNVGYADSFTKSSAKQGKCSVV